MPESRKTRLVLIDGSGYIFRAFFALPPLTDPKGVPTGAVFGFCNMLFRLVQDMAGDQLVVVFDKGKASFRDKIYADYKANRAEPPPDLVPQFPLVREAARAIGLPVVEAENYEADDIIATYAREAREQGQEVIVVSSDKDLMQLIGPGVQMYDPMKQKAIERAEVIERFGVGPELVRDVLALAGDTSDNVPGVPGIGVKTAAQLLQEFHSLDELLANAGVDQAAEAAREPPRPCRAGAPLADPGHLVRHGTPADPAGRAAGRAGRLRGAPGVRPRPRLQIARPAGRALGPRAGEGVRAGREARQARAEIRHAARSRSAR